MTTVHGLVGAFVAIGALAVAGNAGAAGGGEKSDKGKAETSPGPGGSTALGAGDEVGVTGPERQQPKGLAENESTNAKEEEKNFTIWLDFVLGFGKQSVVDANGYTPVSGSSSGTGTSAVPSLAQANVTTYSFIGGLGYEFAKGLGASLRVPLTMGTIASPENRGSVALGNLELEGYYEHHLSDSMGLEFSLGISLPTAQATAIPSSGVPLSGPGYDQSGYDRYAIQNAAAASRGYEENALFDVDRLGINPKIKLLAHGDKWRLTPWVKLENLVATASGYSSSYIGELLLGIDGGYYVAPAFEPALRVWTNIPISGADFTAVAVVEPQLRFHVGDLTPLLGVILPFAGPLTNPYDIGIRAGVSGKF